VAIAPLDNIDGKTLVLFGASGSMATIYAQETRTKSIVFIIVFIVIAGMGWFVHRTMKQTLLEPMRELKYQTESVAGYDLRRIDTPALERKLNSNDEMGHVTRSFATMIFMLRKTIRHIHDGSYEIAQCVDTDNFEHGENVRRGTGTNEQIERSYKGNWRHDKNYI